MGGIGVGEEQGQRRRVGPPGTVGLEEPKTGFRRQTIGGLGDGVGALFRAGRSGQRVGVGRIELLGRGDEDLEVLARGHHVVRLTCCQ